MANENSNAAEESLLDDSPVTESDSMEQQIDEAGESSSDVDNKFVTKTTQKLGDIEQLAIFSLKGNKQLIKQLKEENPELAQRLSRKKKYSHLFEDDSDESESVDAPIKSELIEAARSLEVNGKRLPASDIKKLQGNKEFMKRYKALVNGGYDAFDAAEEAFSKAYPNLASKKGPSVLSGPSEETPYESTLPKLSDKELKVAKSFGLTKEELQKAKALEA